MKKSAITKTKPKTKPKSKPKSKPVYKTKIKNIKQNQNVKVNIKIGENKKDEYRQPPSSHTITTYPIFQDAKPVPNIIHNHPHPVETPIAPIVRIPGHIPVQEPVPLPETINSPLTYSSSSVRLKPIRKYKRVNRDIIPKPTFTSGYNSDSSIDSNVFSKVNPMYEPEKKQDYDVPFTLSDIFDEKPSSTSYADKVMNPVTKRLIKRDGKIHLKLIKDNIL